MLQIPSFPQAITEFKVTISQEELSNKLLGGAKRKNIETAAEKTLEEIKNSWNPAIVYRWLPVNPSNTVAENFFLGESNSTTLCLGHSHRFLTEAKYVMIASYTVGDSLGKEGLEASKKQQFLTAYILDILSLLILEKTGNIVTQMAEKQAAELGWGVSPFLSPGSVHGWELNEQLKLAPLLPLNNIGISINSDGVLIPFKSLICLIGIGPGYDNNQVGSTCQVCSKNKTCQMRQDRNLSF